jgi:carbonic anhydrase
MMQRRRFLQIAVLAAIASSCRHGEDDTGSWGYHGDDGPERWGELSDEYAACANGSEQSPIDLGSATPDQLAGLTIDYRPGAVSIVDNGHTVQADAVNGSDGANSITVGGTRYELLQMHYHTPSEHTIDGLFAPAEAHFVHRSATGNLAVLGIMLVHGETTNSAWGPYTGAMGADGTVETDLDWPAMLPTDTTTVRYPGSLTTPPCSQGVAWMVMRTPVRLSVDQLAALEAVHGDNARPTQPLNDRTPFADESR